MLAVEGAEEQVEAASSQHAASAAAADLRLPALLLAFFFGACAASGPPALVRLVARRALCPSGGWASESMGRFPCEPGCRLAGGVAAWRVVRRSWGGEICCVDVRTAHCCWALCAISSRRGHSRISRSGRRSRRGWREGREVSVAVRCACVACMRARCRGANAARQEHRIQNGGPSTPAEIKCPGSWRGACRTQEVREKACGVVHAAC